MVKEERPTLIKKIDKVTPITQILDVVSQKVIQVNKPAGYYKNREKIKIFIY